jgi:hypothetical protein
MISGLEIYDLIMTKIRQMRQEEYKEPTKLFIWKTHWKQLVEYCDEIGGSYHLHSSEECKKFYGLEVEVTDVNNHLEII